MRKRVESDKGSSNLMCIECSDINNLESIALFFKCNYTPQPNAYVNFSNYNVCNINP